MTICYEAGPPWYQQPHEPDDAYRAFCEWRDQDPPRNARSLDVSVAQRLEWFQRWSWGERVALWDDHVNLVVAQERGAFLAETTRDLAAKHMALLSDARDLAKREIQKLLAESNQSKLSTMKPRDLIRLLTEIVKLDRLIRGESTSNEALEINTDNLTVDELRNWQELSEKAKSAENEDDTRH